MNEEAKFQMNTQKLGELRPCPFCGSEAERIDPNDVWVMCPNHGCRIGMDDMTDKTWNTRPIEDKLQFEIDTLQRRLNVAVHLNADTAEGFDWAVLDKAFQFDDLRKRVKEAVGEIEKLWLHGKADADMYNYDDVYQASAGDCQNILRKHGLIEEE